MSKLPPWRGQSRRDAEAMVAWVNEQLDQEEKIANYFLDYAKSVETDFGINIEKAIELGDKGDVEPLRRLFPELARFLQRPKLKRGLRFPKNREDEPLEKAVNDVKYIRLLWMRVYSKRNRPKGGVSAEQIAADRNGVDVNAVINRFKKSRAE